MFIKNFFRNPWLSAQILAC